MVLVLLNSSLVILARGCRAKNPDLFSQPGRRIRDSSVRQTRTRECHTQLHRNENAVTMFCRTQ
jgi:hypothetical protein